MLACALATANPATAAAESASEPGSPAAERLDAGAHHTCAVDADGRVRCWGFNGQGQLGYSHTMTVGDDETPGWAGPVDLGPGRTATAISAGDYHTCALLDDGSVRCWGFGADGRLGYGNTSNIGDDETPGSVAPVKLGVGHTAKAISAGGGHTCALLDDDTVRCWGFGGNGQLGYGNPNSIGDTEPPEAVGPVNIGTGRTALAISAGLLHTCAVLDDGHVRCWGVGTSGRLGYSSRAPVEREIGDDEVPAALEPVDLGAGRTASAITAGGAHTCVLLDGGSVSCWGSGLDGRLGYGNQDSIGDDEDPAAVGPVNLGVGRFALATTAGARHTCARLDDGNVRCWGYSGNGQLGYGSADSIGDDEVPGPGPVNLGPGRTDLAISAGQNHTCARLDDASVSCWGHGANGRLGYCNERSVGDDEPAAAPGSVPVELAFRAPTTDYAGCARAPAPGSGSYPMPQPGGSGGDEAGNDDRGTALEAEAARTRGFRTCLRDAADHARREKRRARRLRGRRRARLMRHVKRHHAQLRRRCGKRFGRTPGRVARLRARAVGARTVVLTFDAAGTDGDKPPAARTYAVKQSRRPIVGRRGLRRAQTLCKGTCRFPGITQVGGELTLTVKDLRRRATYYYAVAGRDNVSSRLGPWSKAAGVRTR